MNVRGGNTKDKLKRYKGWVMIDLSLEKIKNIVFEEATLFTILFFTKSSPGEISYLWI